MQIELTASLTKTIMTHMLWPLAPAHARALVLAHDLARRVCGLDRARVRMAGLAAAIDHVGMSCTRGGRDLNEGVM